VCLTLSFVLPFYPFPNFYSSLEENWLDYVLKVLFGGLCIGITLSVTRIWIVWYYIRSLLQCLAHRPLAKAFERLNSSLIEGLNIHLTAKTPQLEEFQKSLELLTSGVAKQFHLDVDQLRTQFELDLQKEPERSFGSTSTLKSQTQKLLTAYAKTAIHQLNS